MEKSLNLREFSSILRLTPQGTGKLIKNEESFMRGNVRALPPQTVRKLFESKGFKYPKKNIMFHAIKGGCSKSTLAYNSAYRLSQLGARVLLVDLDKQANATHSFKVPEFKYVFLDIITKRAKIKDAVVNVGPNLDIIPSSFENARLELELINKPHKQETFYENIFKPVRDNYDIVIFDLPPDLNHNSYLCSLYSTTVCVPTNPDQYSVSGSRMTLEALQSIQESYPELDQEILIIWSKYDARETNSFHFITDTSFLENAKVMPVVIRSDSTFKNAEAEKKTVFEFSRKSNAREDVDILAQELLGIRDFFSRKGRA